MTKITEPLFLQDIEESRERLMGLMAQYTSEPDHVAVIIAVSRMDALLGEAIRARLRPSDEGKDSLVDPEPGISTFKLRLLLAQRLGIIDSGFAKALDILRTLRNDFAHTLETQHLHEPPHRDRVNELARRFVLEEGVERMRESGAGTLGVQSSEKIRFVVLSAFMLSRLETAAKIVTQVDDDSAQRIAATLEPPGGSR